MPIVIRPERPDDDAAIDQVNRLAFGRENEGRLVAALRQANSFDPALSLVAVHADKVVGHIMFSTIHIVSAQAEIPALALAPMAVLPDFQRRGLGSELVHQGLKACRRSGHAVAVVLGHPDFYPRFGFVPAAFHGIQAPFPVPDEALMVLALGPPETLDRISGVVRYPSAFNEASSAGREQKP